MIEEATHSYRTEARRRNIGFKLSVVQIPKNVIGDAKKIRTVVSNLTANARMSSFASCYMLYLRPFHQSNTPLRAR